MEKAKFYFGQCGKGRITKLSCNPDMRRTPKVKVISESKKTEQKVSMSKFKNTNFFHQYNLDSF